MSLLGRCGSGFDYENLLLRCQQARFFSVCVFLYKKRKDFPRILQYYIAGLQQQQEAAAGTGSASTSSAMPAASSEDGSLFDFICSSIAEASVGALRDSQLPALRAAILDRLPDLVKADATLTAKIIIQHFAKDNDRSLQHSRTGSSRPPTAVCRPPSSDSLMPNPSMLCSGSSLRWTASLSCRSASPRSQPLPQLQLLLAAGTGCLTSSLLRAAVPSSSQYQYLRAIMAGAQEAGEDGSGAAAAAGSSSASQSAAPSASSAGHSRAGSSLSSSASSSSLFLSAGGFGSALAETSQSSMSDLLQRAGLQSFSSRMHEAYVKLLCHYDQHGQPDSDTHTHTLTAETAAAASSD